MSPVRRFHLSCNNGYPNKYDRPRKRTGSALMVHGSCVSVGCYALVDGAFKAGQTYCAVYIVHFRMTEVNVKRHGGSEWIEFWKNFKEWHDLFERNGVPPRVTVKQQIYVFG